MNRNIALIANGLLFNIIVASLDWANANLSNIGADTAVDITDMMPTPFIGCTYDGTNFYPPIEND